MDSIILIFVIEALLVGILYGINRPKARIWESLIIIAIMVGFAVWVLAFGPGYRFPP